MDINLMVLNVGNSRLAMGAFAAGELGPVVRLPHGSRAQWEEQLGQCWERVSGSDAAVAAASVAPSFNEPLEETVQRVTGKRVLWVGKDLEAPIRVRTDEPQQTGIDRILNIAAAHEQMDKACVVVDAGSAITVDCCNDGGDFLGGAIAPGVSMMLESLHERTAALPRIEFSVPTEVFGRSTEQAILQGIYHGIRGMVKELIERYATELGQWPELIATGGDAQRLFHGWELVHAIAPDLTLYGIALAYVNHPTNQL